MSRQNLDAKEQTAETRSAISGGIYVQFQDEEVERKINGHLIRALKARKGALMVAEGKGSPFSQVCSVLLRPGVSRIFYISNATTRTIRECRNNSCPMASRRNPACCGAKAASR